MAAVAKLQPFVRPELTVGSGRLPVVGLRSRSQVLLQPAEDGSDSSRWMFHIDTIF